MDAYYSNGSSPSHSRTPSEDSTSSGSTTYRLILDHILQYPSSYEIPLRTMYTLNVGQRAQQLPTRSKSSHSKSSSKSSSRGQSPAFTGPGAAAADFTSNLMSHLAQLPCQPCSLPPSFIVSFVRRCFHPELTKVDFPQALAALDYLRDLENRRSKEIHDAFRRLDIHRDAVDPETGRVESQHPALSQWAEKMIDNESKIEALYTQVYVGLRCWIMINEMSLTPFNKHNCLAMLNTLYPPPPPLQAVSPNAHAPPTPVVNPTTMLRQRQVFFNYIQSVEKHGVKSLKPLLEHGRLQGERTGWGAVQHTLDRYLTVATTMIEDSAQMVSIDQLRTPTPEEPASRKGRKTDSGVSFGSDKRPSTSTSGNSAAHEKSKHQHSQPAGTPIKGPSALEKITRELKKMRLKPRASQVDLRQQASQQASAPPQEAQPLDLKPRKTLKKMRSMGALGRTPSDTPEFDPEFMKKQRRLYESSRNRNMAY